MEEYAEIKCHLLKIHVVAKSVDTLVNNDTTSKDASFRLVSNEVL